MAWWNRNKARPRTTSRPVDPAMPLIRLEGITKMFAGDADGDDGETRALDGVTLDIDRGEYISLSGPSGCGKSTLLSILGLLDAPTSGRYWFAGRRVDQLSPGEKARMRNVDVGLIFQSFNLIGDMTVYENVEYPLTLRGVTAADRKAARSTPRSSASASAARGQAAAGIAVGRPPAARRDRPRHRRPAADRARRRADRQPRFEERRGGDADARGAARRRRRRSASPRTIPRYIARTTAPHLPLRRPRRPGTGRAEPRLVLHSHRNVPYPRMAFP